MARRALLIGIDEYDSPGIRNLAGCAADAEEMAEILSRNGDGSLNFDCRTLLGPGAEASITRPYLRRCWRELFEGFDGDILFYFSGHGFPGQVGGYLVTQDSCEDDPGLPMNEIIDMANGSTARTVLIILDCCHSGAAGNVAPRLGELYNQTVLREGVTILAASRPTQSAIEVSGHGVFTDLLLGALKGGASDLRGRISAAPIYGYVEAALGPWDQRPLYKSHAGHLDPVRTCLPKVPDPDLREILDFFAREDGEYPLDPTYEETSDTKVDAHVVIFKKFKKYQIGGLLRPATRTDLYWTAMHSEKVMLTELGQFYHKLVTTGRI